MARKNRRSSTRSRSRVHTRIEGQVLRAAPIARRLVMLGVDPADGTLHDNFFRFAGVNDLTNTSGELQIPEAALYRVMRVGESAYAIGIAVGLLMRAEAFTGGAR